MNENEQNDLKKLKMFAINYNMIRIIYGMPSLSYLNDMEKKQENKCTCGRNLTFWTENSDKKISNELDEFMNYLKIKI
ncbi:Hypothetical protein KVN_LOCUS383 [uncultured virus]|nr:Hypothetical protein KVN_LOCUS383 [uncultured virus]